MPDLNATIDTGEARRLAALLSSTPSIIQITLRDALKTLMAKVQGSTPEGIRRVKLPKTVKRKRGVSQARWVASGKLKKSWLGELTGNSIAVRANVVKWKYPWVLEEGKYPGVPKKNIWGLGSGGVMLVSPRTVRSGGKIYSTRAIGGILDPITKDDSLLNTMTQSIVNQMRKVLG